MVKCSLEFGGRKPSSITLLDVDIGNVHSALTASVFSPLKWGQGTSLVFQWLKLHLPMQKVQVQSLVRALGAHAPCDQKTRNMKQKQQHHKLLTKNSPYQEKENFGEKKEIIGSIHCRR